MPTLSLVDGDVHQCIAALKQRTLQEIADLTGQVGYLTTEVRSLQEEMTMKHRQLGTLSGQMGSLGGQVRNLDDHKVTTSVHMVSKDRETGGIGEQVAHMEKELQKCSSRLSGKDREFSGLGDTLVALNAQMESLSRQLEAQDVVSSGLQRRSNTLNGQLLTVSGRVEAFASDMNARDRQATALTSQVNSLATEVSDLKQRMTTKDHEVSNFIRELTLATCKVDLVKVSTANKATSAFGAAVRQGVDALKNGTGALSGGAHPFDFTHGFVHAVKPHYIVIAWDEPVSVAYIAFRLYDDDMRVYTYDLEYIDPLGVWHQVCRDHRGSSWQRFSLLGSWRKCDSVDVKAFRWLGISDRSEELRIVDVEAV